MRGRNLNFDCLDFRDQLVDLAFVQWIFAEHPEWDKAPHSFNSSADRKSTKSWRGDTRVADIDVVQCCKDGWDNSLKHLCESDLFNEEELNIGSIVKNEPGVDMLRPCWRKTSVGVHTGDQAQYNLELDNKGLVDLAAKGDDKAEEIDAHKGD